ncbi:MAG: S8 family serine peptidase, partial [Candidatus Zixiibacteriota bacterium]
AQAMYYAANMGATAVNCSWGSSNSGGLADAVDYAISQGVLVVAAAGNANSETFDYLGGRTDVMDVAATDSFDVRASFSNYGTWVEVSAPGVDVLSTFHSYDDPANDYIAMISGTSQACPHVVGLAALLKSYEPTLSSSDIWNYIVNYADPIDHLNPGYEGKLGSGRINAYVSLSEVGEPPPPDTIPPADVTDLSASTGSSNGTVDLTWTAPGDDGNTGTAATYDVRYQLATLGPLDTEVEWSAASQATGEPAPQSAGSTENFTVGGLTPGTAYYFALKTADEVPNWSGLSNTDFATAAEISDQPMFVELIAMRLTTAGINVTAYAKPQVVEDDTGNPALESVTIYGHWYGATSDVDQCITGLDGTCEVASNKVKNPSQDFCFQVDSLKKTSYYWDDTKGVTYNCISPGAGKHAELVSEFSAQNYPNPFNPATEFSLSLPQDAHVSFIIYNVMGQKVRTLADDYFHAGTHTIRWDGTNESGETVSSGIYFYRVVAADKIITKKMILMK